MSLLEKSYQRCARRTTIYSTVFFIHFFYRTLRCPHTINCRNITETNVNTTQQQNSPYDGVGHVLDVHNYAELSTREHQYTNTNLSSN